jgi:ATP-dependent helicase YprA (DUF1998 family)
MGYNPVEQLFAPNPSQELRMDVDAFLREIGNRRGYRGQMVHVHDVPARKASFKKLRKPLHPAVRGVLARRGIEKLYSHQASAIEAIRRGENVVVVTGTASGKTLCYNLPVIETLLAEPHAKAIYLYPTKALAQDQLRGLNDLKALDPTLPWRRARTTATRPAIPVASSATRATSSSQTPTCCTRGFCPTTRAGRASSRSSGTW